MSEREMEPSEFADELACLVEKARDKNLEDRVIINGLRSKANQMEPLRERP